MRYSLLLITLILFLSPIFAKEINIDVTQPDTGNKIRYIITITENGEPQKAELSLYYFYEGQIQKIEKSIIFGSLTKEVSIDETGEYELKVYDTIDGVMGSAVINVEEIKEEIIEVKNKEEEERLVSKEILILLGAVVIIILIFAAYKIYKVPRIKKMLK